MSRIRAEEQNLRDVCRHLTHYHKSTHDDDDDDAESSFASLLDVGRGGGRGVAGIETT